MSQVRQMAYRPVGDRWSTVEVMTFQRLRELNDGGTQRADFQVVAIVDSGLGTVTVDFARHPLSARSAVWIRPGAVHRWDDIADVAGHLALFVPTAPVTAATRERVALPGPTARWRVPGVDWDLVDAARHHLLLETSAPPETRVPGLPEIVLSALVARLDPPHDPTVRSGSTFRQFQASVEENFRAHHDVGYYAHTLGYAPRTLSRAAQQATGRTAKAFIADRIVLEARRLLAHDGLTAARCATRLGFRDASNFSVFYRNATGSRPGAWLAETASG